MEEGNKFEKLNNILDSAELSEIKVSSIETFEDILFTLANIAVLIAAAASLIALAISLFQYTVNGRGDPKIQEKARNGILWSVLALVVSLLLYTIKTILITILGSDADVLY